MDNKTKSNLNLNKFPYLKDLRDSIMIRKCFAAPDGTSWEHLGVEEKFLYYQEYQETEKNEAAYHSYLSYPLCNKDLLGPLRIIDAKDNGYIYYFDKDPDVCLTADLMNGWDAPRNKYLKQRAQHADDSSNLSRSDKAYYAFLKVVYSIGNVTLCGFNFGGGGNTKDQDGKVSDQWDVKLVRSIFEANTNQSKRQGLKDNILKFEKLGIHKDELIKSLLWQDYFCEGFNRVHHIWRAQNSDVYGLTGKLRCNNQNKESFGVRNEIIKLYIRVLQEIEPNYNELLFWADFFANSAKIIIQRGYRIDKPFTGKWNEARAKEVCEAFEAVGLPSDPDKVHGLPYTIIGEWEEVE